MTWTPTVIGFVSFGASILILVIYVWLWERNEKRRMATTETAPKEPVFCKDCAHCIPERPGSSAKCRMHEAINVVSGERGFFSCEYTRFGSMYCGHDGKWFEPKTEGDVKL